MRRRGKGRRRESAGRACASSKSERDRTTDGEEKRRERGLGVGSGQGKKEWVLHRVLGRETELTPGVSEASGDCSKIIFRLLFFFFFGILHLCLEFFGL